MVHGIETLWAINAIISQVPKLVLLTVVYYQHSEGLARLGLMGCFERALCPYNKNSTNKVSA